MAASRFALTRRGFTAQQTERLIALKIRYERGQFGFLSTDEKRLGFGAG